MKKLLIADDVATNLRLVSEVLKGEYKVITAKSGEQALHLIPATKPDIILLDIGMPKMDGYRVMDELKRNPATANIPVIFLTGDTSKEAEAKALHAGAMDYIRKPFEPMVLKSRIEKALSIADIRNDLETNNKKDSLTGLWNRTYIEEYMQEQDAMSSGYLFMLDLDNFKGLNDNFGHVLGDKALVCFANTLTEIGGENDIICRLGGDEFVIYKKSAADREEIRSFAREIITKVEYNINNLLSDSFEKTVSVSIGIATYPDDGEDFLTLYNSSDKALYYVKQNGKRGYHFFQDDCRSINEMSRENAVIDMEQLKMLISESGENSGAYQVEYEGFKRIYRFVNRVATRTGQNVQVVLFTLNLRENCTDETRISDCMLMLENNISGLLRRADVATRFSDNQYVVILMDANKDNGLIAVNRVLNKFKDTDLYNDVELNYDIQDIVKEKK